MATTTAPDGTTIHFDMTGVASDSPGVVLVHGITENASTWDPIVERLAPAHQVAALDLRGHGRSAHADRYDLEAMASDVGAVIDEARLDRPHVVGHSLGGAVVSVVGATVPVRSVVDVDQSLRFDEFKGQLMAFEDQLRDPQTFPLVIDGLFEMMAGDKISEAEIGRVNVERRADQEVVLGVWELLLSSSPEEIAAVVDDALRGYTDSDVAYLTVFGIDPGEGYDAWITQRIAGAVTEVWADHGHYPHLVDPDRFVERLEQFWS